MKTQHTRGPWQVETRRITTEEMDIWIYAPNGDDCHRHVCMVDSGDKALSNARLIAASPELLAACKTALPLLDKLLEASRSIDGIVASRVNLENNIGDLRSAIAKATE